MSENIWKLIHKQSVTGHKDLIVKPFFNFISLFGPSHSLRLRPTSFMFFWDRKEFWFQIFVLYPFFSLLMNQGSNETCRIERNGICVRWLWLGLSPWWQNPHLPHISGYWGTIWAFTMYSQHHHHHQSDSLTLLAQNYGSIICQYLLKRKGISQAQY